MTQAAAQDQAAPPQRQQRAGKTAQSAGQPQSVLAGYKGKDAPLGGYAALMGLYGLTVGGMLWAASRNKDRPLADSVKLGDILLLGVATHKVSRLITKDWVTSPIRAPFTEYKESTGEGEVEEKARGEGMQLAMGQLLT